jgi:DUF4097 and DUF4098 domain-containing protein YvlB
MNFTLVVVLLLLMFLLAMRGFSFSFSVGEMETETVDNTAPLGNGGKLSVLNRNGSIQIGSWTGEGVKIHAVKRTRVDEDELKKADVQITPNGNDLEIKTVYSESNVKVSVDYEILVPAGGLIDKVTTSNGSIKVRELGGNITAESSNGSISGEQLKGGISASTSNGSIKLDGVAGEVTAGSTNGSIHIREARSVAEAETTNGNVEVELQAMPDRDVSIASTNGSVTVHVPDGINADVSMSTSNGRVSAKDVNLNGAESTRTRINGKLGVGGRRLRIETSNGNATLKKR